MFLNRWLFFLVGLTLTACSSSRPYHISLDQKAYVTEGDTEPRLVDKGQQLSLSPETSTVIEAPGYPSVLIPPAHFLPTELKVSLKPLGGWINQIVAEQVDKKLSELFLAINEVQGLISRNEGAKAITQINLLEKKYPGLASLRFFKVSALLVQKKTSEAKLVLEAAAKEFPESEAGKRLQELFQKRAGL